MGCPDRRIDRLMHYVLYALPTFTSRQTPSAISLRRKRDGIPVTLAPRHQSDALAYGGDNVGNFGATIASDDIGITIVIPANGVVVFRRVR